MITEPKEIEQDEDDKADAEDGDLADGPARSNAAADRFEDDEPRSNDWTDWPSSFHGGGWRRMGGSL